MKSYHLSLTNRIEQLQLLHEAVVKISGLWGIDDKYVFKIDLCLEEIVSNIIKYGYSDNKKHKIDIDFILNSGNLTVKIVDDATEFNPVDYQPVSIDKPLEERKVGGLGIHFVKKLMDSVEYNRNNEFNELTLNIEVVEK